MIQRLLSYKIPLVLVLSLFIVHLVNKDFTNPYERPIAGDAQAYYAYLPALFIYNDLKYDFVPTVNEKYYPVEHQKSFLTTIDGNKKVNKTFPGVALLYLPFFLIAHALALIFGLEADGYSTIYQVLFDIGLWTYLALALVFLTKVLRVFQFTLREINGTIIILLLGTNLFFYSVFDQSVTHIYNFFMINALVFYLLKFKETNRYKWIGISVFLLALIGITRPTNILAVGVVIFFIPNLNFYKNAITILLKGKHIWKTLVISLSVLAIPFLLWKAQSNHWVVYSYGEEGFNFAQPHFTDFLFSYLKGWFTYTPIALIALIIGFIFLFKTDKKRFFIGISFYFIAVYIFSSWWCWYYGAGMGQRVMIDHFLIIAFLIISIIRQISLNKTKILVLSLATGICVFLNVVQAFQIRYGIITGGSATQQQYWDSMLKFEKEALVYPHDHWVLKNEAIINLNSAQVVKGKAYNVEGDWCIITSEYTPYSASVSHRFDKVQPGSKLIYKFDARARNTIKATRAVITLGDETFVFGLDNYLKKDEWVHIEFLYEPKQTHNTAPVLFFWNGNSTEKTEFKNLIIQHYYSEAYL